MDKVDAEPVAFRMRHHLETEERDWSVMPIRFLERNNHPVYVIEMLYTRPQSDELRRAAEEAGGDLMLWTGMTNTVPEWLREKLYEHAQNLRKALEKK